MNKTNKESAYLITEEQYIQHMFKVEDERDTIKHVLSTYFAGDEEWNEKNVTLLCEHYAALGHLEDALYDETIVYNDEQGGFLCSQLVATKMVVFLESLSVTKDLLHQRHIFISKH